MQKTFSVPTFIDLRHLKSKHAICLIKLMHWKLMQTVILLSHYFFNLSIACDRAIYHIAKRNFQADAAMAVPALAPGDNIHGSKLVDVTQAKVHTEHYSSPYIWTTLVCNCKPSLLSRLEDYSRMRYRKHLLNLFRQYHTVKYEICTIVR